MTKTRRVELLEAAISGLGRAQRWLQDVKKGDEKISDEILTYVTYTLMGLFHVFEITPDDPTHSPDRVCQDCTEAGRILAGHADCMKASQAFLT